MLSGHRPYLARTLPSSDQRQGGALPAVPQARGEPATLRATRIAGTGNRRLCRLLQLPQLPQGTGRRNTRRCPLWKEIADPRAQRGDADTNT